ncbi:hypothetical protein PQQ63_20350 [Paraburkholderia metrosideri]|uniref:Uncharacterized protein n=1 Tax=Paraburkholderia metrosideri TaxID=580937 RepID=A0ABW9DUL1_9BURK
MGALYLSGYISEARIFLPEIERALLHITGVLESRSSNRGPPGDAAVM